MKRLDFEERNNKKRAFVLSIGIHVILIGYIGYAGVQLVRQLGSGVTEIDFVSEPHKGKQLSKFKEVNSSANAKVKIKAKRSNTKVIPTPKPKPKKIVKVKASKDVKKSDVLVAKKKTQKKTIPTKLPKKVIKKPVVEEKDELEKELAALSKENSIQKGPNSVDRGNDKVDTKEQTAKFGDPNAVKSYKELTPIAGNRPPAYPQDAARQRYEPEVIIDFFVKPDGSVGDIRFIKPAAMGSVNSSVYRAVKKWRFRRGKTGFFRQDFKFRLNQPTKIIPERLKRKK